MKKNRTILDTLERVGLNESEARLYLTLLDNGASSVADLARLVGTSRQAVYLLLPALTGHGLLKEVQYGRRRLYQAMPPSQLNVLADETRQQLNQIIPELASRSKDNQSVPLITVYENPLAMREWYEHFLSQAKKGEDMLIWSTGIVNTWYDLDPRFYDRYLRESKEIGVRFRTLLPKIKESEEHRQIIGWSTYEYRYIEKELNRSIEQWVWHDSVCYLTLNGISTNLIVLESKELADYTRKIFELIWSSASKEA